MIDYIRGKIAELNPAFAVIDNHGVGYMMNITLSTYDVLTKAGEEALLYAYEVIREDAHTLYGFASKQERDALFKTVKGVGGKTAQRIIVDLKDKIKPTGDTLLVVKGQPHSEVFDEALAALVMLGFTQQASNKALKSLFAANPSLSVESAIKQALKMM